MALIVKIVPIVKLILLWCLCEKKGMGDQGGSNGGGGGWGGSRRAPLTHAPMREGWDQDWCQDQDWY